MKKIYSIAYIFIVTQAILSMLMAIFLLSEQYMTKWTNYPDVNQSVTIYLKNVDQNKQMSVQQYMFQAASEHHLLIIRKDALTNNGGYFSGYKFGIVGDPTVHGASLSFLGTDILNTKNLGKLLASKSQTSTLGVDKGSINSIGAIPYFYFGGRIVVEKMPQLINESATVNGTYSVLGFNVKVQKNQFISDLSKISGLSQTALTTQTNGANTDNSFQLDILIVFLALNIFLNSILFLIVAVRRLPEQGTLTLLGWSRISFASKILGTFFITSIIGSPIFVGIGWLLSGWNTLSFDLLSYLFMAAVINFAVVGVELAIASAVIMMTSSLNAIHRRFSKRPLYIFGIFAYLLVSAGLVASAGYVDGPMQLIAENARIIKNWAKVSDYQMLSSISVGQDTASISGQSTQLNQDIYDWYKSMANKKGVFLIHTDYYSRSLLTSWLNDNTYKVIPEKPFWRFVMSPNYLSGLDIKISNDDLSKAENGTRLYLLPSTLSSVERNHMMAWLRESDSESGGINNKFSRHPKFKFVMYPPKAGLFTWSSDVKSPIKEFAPIIAVTVPENMAFIDSQSLRANAFDGYIKFANSKVMQHYTEPKRLSRFNLADNHLSFASVQQYTDGLQKNLWTTIRWFGLIFVFLFILLVGLLITLAMIFRIANQEKINVKKFLGFSFWQLYKTPTCMLLSVIILELAVSIAIRSKFGTLLIAIMSLLQLLIFVRYMTRSELKRILIAFKGGS